jgi:hypothetical protein
MNLSVMRLVRALIVGGAMLCTVGITLVADAKALGQQQLLISKMTTPSETVSRLQQSGVMAISTTTAEVLFSLRGGKKDSDVITMVKDAIISVLKQVIPRSFWPTSWSKGSKLTKNKKSKEGAAEGGSRLHKVHFNPSFIHVFVDNDMLLFRCRNYATLWPTLPITASLQSVQISGCG